MPTLMSRYLGGTMIEGGSDTTSAFLQCIVLAFIAFPETLKKAQEEIDRVIGRDRLPTVADRDQLPYVNALMLEALRWHTVVPMGSCFFII